MENNIMLLNLQKQILELQIAEKKKKKNATREKIEKKKI